jgi:hypothetical protein
MAAKRGNAPGRNLTFEIFTARCEARARLWANGDLDLHQAVDVLQAAAVTTGLVAAIGQDAAQKIMSKAFGRSRRLRETT